MSAPLVKICGLTNLEDALHAARSGADLLGFVLAPSSPRYVTAEQVTALVAALRAQGCHLPCIGVVADKDPAQVRALVAASSVDLVQLHGYAPKEAAALANPGVPVIPAHRVRGHVPWAELAARPAWAYLLDGYAPNALGGAGVAWDWALLEQDATSPQAARVRQRLFVAGGLTPENVAEVVRRLHPLGVDVSSGVEAAPGCKDPTRVERFIRNAKEAAL
ncbi:MAG: phosphoribosylanthranilate isomerase [Anaerolineae bacterium]